MEWDIPGSELEYKYGIEAFGGYRVSECELGRHTRGAHKPKGAVEGVGPRLV